MRITTTHDRASGTEGTPVSTDLKSNALTASGLPIALRPRLSHCLWGLSLIGIAGLTTGCADGSSAEPTPTPAIGADDPDNGENDGSDPEPTLPPEQEDSFYRARPANTDRYVFVVNPDRDTVSKINAGSRAVYTLPVGAHPTQVEVGYSNPDKAVVLNEGESTLSIIGVQDDSVKTVGIHPDTNYMALSGDGRHAITWFNANVEGAYTGVDGVRSYSSISVIDTGDANHEPVSTPLTVALNPRGATFIPSTNQALVLCDDALAQVTLTNPPTYRLIPLTQDIDENLTVAEMKVSNDGHYAWVRLLNVADLIVVDLNTSDPLTAVTRLPLSAIASDMDLAERNLVLVDRDNRALEVYDAQDPDAEPQFIPTPLNQLVGAVELSSDLQTAILYTTLTSKDIAGTSEEDTPLNRFSVWDLSDNSITLHELVKPVESVFLNHTSVGDVATFIHQGDATSSVSTFNKAEAFSHYYFSDGLVAPVRLESPMKSLADDPDGRYEFMILEDSLSVVVIDYQTRQVSSLDAQSQPAFVGILTGSNVAYVSQEHELGRISFIDAETSQVNTITGFELNSQP